MRDYNKQDMLPVQKSGVRTPSKEALPPVRCVSLPQQGAICLGTNVSLEDGHSLLPLVIGGAHSLRQADI
jgi:hypothetical protein